MPSSSSSAIVQVVSKCTVYPEPKSTTNITNTLKLSVSDLPMLSCQYIQKGVLLSEPPLGAAVVLPLLKLSLSITLSHFPALAGRLHTDPDGHVHILCNDAGALFVHAKARDITVPSESLLYDHHQDIPEYFRKFFQFDNTLSYAGHSKPLVVIQVTELNGGVFIGCTMNHAVVDGTSFWNFFNTFAEVCKFKGPKSILRSPDFSRDTVFNSPAVLRFPEGGPSATFSGDEPLREKIFHFSREAIVKMKLRANGITEICGKITNGGWMAANGVVGVVGVGGGKANGVVGVGGGKTNGINGKITPRLGKSTAEISSFQSLCAQLWRCVTRARNLDEGKTTTFRMAVNCRHRVDPRLHPLYFGNAIQSIPTVAAAGELLLKDLSWSADKLHQNVVAHDDATVRRGVEDWESSPRLFPLGNFDGAMITMGSSPRFPMYDNDFGWGKPIAVRSGRANKFDGKISAFPGREGNGSVDLEVVLAPETMAALEKDLEFMQYVSS